MKSGQLDFGLETQLSSTSLANKVQIYIFSFATNKLHTNYQMAGKINSLTCLMLSVYKSCHQTIKYGQQRNRILQDFTVLEI